ncbi:MAG TPA: DUF3574 domain-containing protein [Thermoanaerobaculia bacterium]|nr:DUF3574 domain-containing protein [Thermoanaerobaculia bacterium]
MRRLSLALILLLTTACVSTAPSVADRLFCGLTIPGGGGEVTEEQWRAFVREEVTPRFPDGLTLWRAEGQWREQDGEIVREPVLIIEILHRHSLAIDGEINAIAEAYKRRFQQEAVMRVTTPARLEFID